MGIKLGTPVRQIIPAPVAGIVVKKQFDEQADKFQVLVEWLSDEERAANVPLQAAFDTLETALLAAVEAEDKAVENKDASAIAAAQAELDAMRKAMDAIEKPTAPHSRWFFLDEVVDTTPVVEGEAA